ncbi:MAG TPA: hypothetical protein VHX40_05120, partial [Acidimicrobiales bacterium]|nr:hypothetical protein [Acidimicrobiales bacterium]
MAATDALARLGGKALVVFDLDGTLYDDQTYLRPADRAIAAHLAAAYGRPEPDVVAVLDDVLACYGMIYFLNCIVCLFYLMGYH